ncbi:MAG TPA: tyrosine-type recombinase/integrase [Actinomycetota bacterium]|nr:tyrosine-type recombinase/integrase [Actinomycetota bacterium]
MGPGRSRPAGRNRGPSSVSLPSNTHARLCELNHDLRHSSAALLIAQGAHPKEIQAQLGHASITTTLNTYGHLWPSLGEALDERMEETVRTARADVASM